MSYVRALGLLRRALPHIDNERGLASMKLCMKLLLSAALHARRLSAMAGSSSPTMKMVAAERPQALVGPLIWPYLCAGWTVDERLDHIAAHHHVIDSLSAPFPFSTQERLILSDLQETYPGLRIVLDQPQWFMREGGLTISLFIEDFRAYSLAFSLAQNADGTGLDCRIGSLQGRNAEQTTDLYRSLTKAAHGLRPRDFLLEICRILCRHWGVTRLLGVRDSQRHHRHPFFSNKQDITQDYDAIWRDRGGVDEDTDFYRLPIASERRMDEDIKPNKRSLYRRRYRFLDMLETEIPEQLPHLQPQCFADR